MTRKLINEKQRLRAPSRRSLESRARILDAAERVFADRGFNGASLRDIATEAGVQVGLVHHHGGGKEGLFEQVVARRADELSQRRLAALEARRATGPLTVVAVLECFFKPYVEAARTGGPQWLAYARLVAHVSADARWRGLAARYFDPTASRFIAELCALLPETDRTRIATGFVYSVAAMLAQFTAAWRVGALGEGDEPDLASLVGFCAAGFDAFDK